ncbi:MAG: DUF2851 family protein, partial [Planctomycetota bacterium]|nr:DUF2851 family protein [Planctomycetota bacterium]
MLSSLSPDIIHLFPGAQEYLSLKHKVAFVPSRQSRPESIRGQRCRDKKREPEFEKISEKFIHYLWAEQPLKDLSYRTSDNKTIKIVSTGLWNPQPGPDFTEASLYLDDQLYKGDIEIHLYSSDWFRHQHHLDNRYNNLILHITLWADEQRPIRLNNKKEVPQLVLIPLLRERLEDVDKLLELDSSVEGGRYFVSTGRCYSYLKKTPAERITHFLQGAGESRLLRKVDNFRNRLFRLNQDYNEVLYQGIMSALGYKNNRLTFLQLAETLPYQKIRQVISGCPAEKRPLAIQFIMLKTAGLLPSRM